MVHQLHEGRQGEGQQVAEATGQHTHTHTPQENCLQQMAFTRNRCKAQMAADITRTEGQREEREEQERRRGERHRCDGAGRDAVRKQQRRQEVGSSWAARLVGWLASWLASFQSEPEK